MFIYHNYIFFLFVNRFLENLFDQEKKLNLFRSRKNRSIWNILHKMAIKGSSAKKHEFMNIATCFFSFQFDLNLVSSNNGKWFTIKRWTGRNRKMETRCHFFLLSNRFTICFKMMFERKKWCLTIHSKWNKMLFKK